MWQQAAWTAAKVQTLYRRVTRHEAQSRDCTHTHTHIHTLSCWVLCRFQIACLLCRWQIMRLARILWRRRRRSQSTPVFCPAPSPWITTVCLTGQYCPARLAEV